MSLPKLKAGGALAEIQVVLGWTFNTQTLTIGLPTEKFTAWGAELKRISRARRCTFGEMKSLARRLGHASYAIPLTRQFLERIDKMVVSDKNTRKSTNLNLPIKVVADLQLWMQFLVKAHRGVSMNLVTIR